MMGKALVVSIGVAAMLALAACSGNDVDQSEYDAVRAERDAAAEDLKKREKELEDVRKEVAEEQADVKEKRARLQEARDLYFLAEQNARAAEQAAKRDLQNGQPRRNELTAARVAAAEARKVAEEAEKEAEKARTDAETVRSGLQALVNAATVTGPLPTGHSGVGAQTVDDIQPGRSRIIGNVEFACKAGDYAAEECEVVVTRDGQFTRNSGLITATVIEDPVAERLLIGSPDGTELNEVHFNPADEEAPSDSKVSVYIRQAGADDVVYDFTFSLVPARTTGQYAGTPDERPDGHADFVGLSPTIQFGADGAATGWSVTDLDGMVGVTSMTDFSDSSLPEDERWTKGWRVTGTKLTGGRVLDLDMRTDTVRTTTRDLDVAFPTAADRTAVMAALEDGGLQLVDNRASGVSGPQGDTMDHIPLRYGAQLEIQAESNEQEGSVTLAQDTVDESKWIRFRIGTGANELAISTGGGNRYQLSALDDTDAGTTARFYGIPGKVVCGGNPINCGQAVHVEEISGANYLHLRGGPGATSPAASNPLTGGSAGLTFTADDGDHEFYVADTDWVSIGVWTVRPESGASMNDVQAGAFVHGSLPFVYSTAVAAGSLSGEAEYVGDAVGRYAEKVGTAAARTGKFTATAEFTFDFDDENVSGSIEDFKLNDAATAQNWSLTMAARPIAALVEFDGTQGTSDNSDENDSGGPRGVLVGLAEGFVMEGRLNMRLFGPAGDNPTAVAGTFHAEQKEARERHDLSLIGAFAAKPAASE